MRSAGELYAAIYEFGATGVIVTLAPTVATPVDLVARVREAAPVAVVGTRA